MPDFGEMYFHLAGRMAAAIDALDEAARALTDLTDKLRLAQETTEEMYLEGADDAIDAFGEKSGA